MKLQIRKGVFETNSSSVHTLSIQKTKMDFDWDKFGTNGVVELGKTTTKELETLLGKTVLNITELPMQTKLDLLFYSQLSKELTRDFVEGVCLITKFLNEKGFKVVLNYFNAMDNSGYLHWMISSEEGVLKTIKDNIATYDEIESFLLSDFCVFTLWNDECCSSEPVEITLIRKTFKKMPKDKYVQFYYR